jgi:predicted hydrocarbon binding protein
MVIRWSFSSITDTFTLVYASTFNSNDFGSESILPTDAISRDREKGWVVEDGKRLITFRLMTFQSFENRLISLVGDEVSKMILYQMGNEIGRVAYDYSREAIKSESDLGPVLDSILSDRGWGRCGVFVKETRDGEITFTVQATGTPSSHERTSVKPTCDIESGIASGFLEAYFGKKAHSHSELACVSTRSLYCMFETTFNQ